MASAPRYSFIIPAYNEEAYLPRLLDTVDVARAEYKKSILARGLEPANDPIEVIVADNTSRDRTAAIAEARGCRVVRVEKRVIGAARNGGGRAARGEILAFCDADMQIHPQTFNVIDAALTDNIVAGATGAFPDRWSAGLIATLMVMMPLALLLRVDSGVVFCRREDFERIGGYSETRLYAEDLQFLHDLWRVGRARGQRLTRATKARTIASTRKFDTHGDWHFFTMPLRLARDLLRGADAKHRTARQYWYEDR